MRHTEGPWTIGDVQWIMNQQTKMGYSYRPITAGSWELATVWEDDDDSEMTANVHLIAAAPDLLAALIRMDEEFGTQNYTKSADDAVMMAQAAIKKATGGE